MKDYMKRKTAVHNPHGFGLYEDIDLYGAGHSKRINEGKRKQKRRARHSMKQELKRIDIDEW